MSAPRDQLSSDSSVIRSNLADSDLVSRCLRGETRAYEVLVERYQTPLFNTALRMTGEYEVAKDITQDALIKAYEKLDTYRPTYKFFSWIYRILVNDALNLIRQRKFEQDIPAHVRDARPTPEEEFWSGEQGRLLDCAIRELAFDQRLVIVLRHFSDMSYEQIAGILDIPAKTVKSRLYTARQNLALILEQKGIGAL